MIGDRILRLLNVYRQVRALQVLARRDSNPHHFRRTPHPIQRSRNDCLWPISVGYYRQLWVVLCRSWLGSVPVKSNANAWSSGVQFRTTMRIELIVRAPSGAAFVNQALAMKLSGLDPSGFDPHAFARSGLRAPLTSGLRPARRPAGRLARPSTFTSGSSSSFGSGSPQWPIRYLALPATGFRGISSAR